MSPPYRSLPAIGQEGTISSVTDREVSIGGDGPDAETRSGADTCILDQDAPARRLIEAIGDKWSLLCIYALDDGPVRFNALERRVAGITQKVLSQTLRKLERMGLVTRTIYAEVPPRVEYALSPLGASLRPITSAMCDWSTRHAASLTPQVD